MLDTVSNDRWDFDNFVTCDFCIPDYYGIILTGMFNLFLPYCNTFNDLLLFIESFMMIEFLLFTCDFLTLNVSKSSHIYSIY